MFREGAYRDNVQKQLLMNLFNNKAHLIQREHSAILSTFINLQFVFKTFVLSIFEWPLKTGFTVLTIFF